MEKSCIFTFFFSATPKHFAPDITHPQIMYGILGVYIFCSKSLASSGRRSLRLLRSCWHLVVVLQTTSAAMATTSWRRRSFVAGEHSSKCAASDFFLLDCVLWQHKYLICQFFFETSSGNSFEHDQNTFESLRLRSRLKCLFGFSCHFSSFR